MSELTSLENICLDNIKQKIVKKFNSIVELEKDDYIKLNEDIDNLKYIYTLYIPDCDNHLNYDFFYKYKAKDEKDYVVVLHGVGEGMMCESSPEEALKEIFQYYRDSDYNISVYHADDHKIFSKYLEDFRSLASKLNFMMETVSNEKQ